MSNNEELLKNLIFEKGIKALRSENELYLKKLIIDNKYAIETINLLQQANNTTRNVNILLKNNEIVDSATLMRSCMEKIIMAMMIYFDPDKTYEEFKNLKDCGITYNTTPNVLIKRFSGKLKEINSFMFSEFGDDELLEMLREAYKKLCLYTHSSVVVSVMIEVSKNDDTDLFITFFYLMSEFLEILLYCCLRYLCDDDKDYIELIINILAGWALIFSTINKNKLNLEYLEKYKEYLYWDINYDFNNRYKNILEKTKSDSKELIILLNENINVINDYFKNLVQKN